jgi:hypothetical protein
MNLFFALCRPDPRRRGMLLLLVLLMLALFLGAGAILLTVAIRARAAARANAATIAQATVSDALTRTALDQALMALLRGNVASGTTGSVTISGTLENILADKYGPPTTGTGSIATGSSAPVMALSLTGLRVSSTTPASRLNGRILTIKPRSGQTGDITSLRIVGAVGTGSSGTCYVARQPSFIPLALPTGPFDVVINGREFTPLPGTSTPEPYDAPDDANAWLASPAVVSNQITGPFNRLSFWATGSSAYTSGADNDNDGIPDGIWLSGTYVTSSGTVTTGTVTTGTVIPNRPSPLGGTLRFEVSYLVLDLDGRINLNAAGMAKPETGGYASMPDAPLGLGYGPADIDPSLLFSGSSNRPSMPSASGTSAFTGSGSAVPQGLWPTLVLNGTPSLTPAAPTNDQQRRPPIVGNLFGRYGPGGVPGAPNDDTNPLQRTGSATYSTMVAGPNSFGDLKARAKAVNVVPAAGEIMPQLRFIVPTWTGTNNDASDDPYELRLDPQAPRWGTPRRPVPPVAANDDSPFTIAELEAILRPFDSDSRQLPQRLAAGLEDAAQRARSLITVESWDTPGLTGGAARLVEDFLAGPGLQPRYEVGSPWQSGTGSNLVSPDVAAGLRFDLNRPLRSGTTAEGRNDRQRFCKDLYTLIRSLTGTTSAPTADEAAQWVANVVDFRDDDSIMTAFEYDRDLFAPTVTSSNAWNVDGDVATDETAVNRGVVWGGERPEVVITETGLIQDVSSGTNRLFVNLHRLPWNASISNSATNSLTRIEQTHGPLLSTSTSTLDLAKLVSGSSGTSAIWQLRADSSNVVNWHANPIGTPTQFVVIASGSVTSVSRTIVGGTAAPQGLAASGSGAYLCVQSTTTSTPFTITVPAFTVTSGAFSHATTTTGTVSLERLADPTRPNGPANPYISVDAALVRLVSATVPPETMRRIGPGDITTGTALDQRRLNSFWRDASDTANWMSVQTATIGSYAGIGSSGVPWFHWPNRPFISQAELLLVPSGTAGNNATGTRHLLANTVFAPRSASDVTPRSLATGTAMIAFGLSGTTATGTASGTSTLGALILEATHVPSRFAATAVPISGSSANLAGFDGLSTPPTLSLWREPGRVNVNTIIGGTATQEDGIVWAALIGGTSPANPFALTVVGTSGGSTAITPAQSIGQILSLSGSANDPVPMAVVSGTSSRGNNPYFGASLPIRLANTATVRSNVFAVWITVRVTDDSQTPPTIVTKRMFAVIDRSIPVGYSPGEDLNVRDCVRLKRYLD